jgi:membrane-associated phospholipid phosphatase
MLSLIALLAVAASGGGDADAATHDPPVEAPIEPPALELSPAVDASVLGVSGVMFTAVLAIEHGRPPHEATGAPRTVWWFDRTALGRHNQGADTISTILQDTLVVAAPLGLVLAHLDGTFASLTPAIIVVESTVLSAATAHLIKSLVPRPRPYAYAHGYASGEADRSFYSAHTTVAFAAVTSAAVVQSELDGLRLEDSGPLLVGAFGVATAVGILRVAGGQHFPSDAVVGALAGAAIGWMVPLLHHHQGPRLSLVAWPSGLALAGEI